MMVNPVYLTSTSIKKCGEILVLNYDEQKLQLKCYLCPENFNDLNVFSEHYFKIHLECSLNVEINPFVDIKEEDNILFVDGDDDDDDEANDNNDDGEALTEELSAEIDSTKKRICKKISKKMEMNKEKSNDINRKAPRKSKPFVNILKEEESAEVFLPDYGEYNKISNDVSDPEYMPQEPLSDAEDPDFEFESTKKPIRKRIKNRKAKINKESSNEVKRKAPRTWTCSICKETMDPLKRLEHSRTHKVKSYVCEICGKCVRSQFSLQRHKAAHIGIKPYSCSFCPQKFNYRGGLKIHERQHTGEKPYKCTYCEKRFNQKVFLTRHELIHNRPEVMPFTCDICQKTFLRNGELKAHKKTHIVKDLPYKCQYCPSQFKSKDRWRPHEQAHRGEFRYVCGYCPKKFMRKLAKENHELVHTLNGAKPHGCELCGRTYGRINSLRRHVKKNHPDLKKVEYKCTKCDIKFNNTEELQGHNKQHAIENKKFVCPLCSDQRFINELGLVTHINRVHPEEGNYNCKFCKLEKKETESYDKLWKLYKHYAKMHINHIGDWN